MTLQQLEYIIAVHKFSHFSKAAEYCKVTQSTLSAMIKKLEEELGTEIFDRESHPVIATDMGEKIIEQAKVIIFHSGQLKEIADGHKNKVNGKIKIAVIATVAPYIVPRLFNLIRDNSDISINIYESTTAEILDKLKKAEIDMAIMATPCGKTNLIEIPLYYEKLMAYISPSEDELFEKDEIKSFEMPTKKLWMLNDGHCLRNQIFNFCGKNYNENPMYEAGSISTLINIVDENGGYAIIPELHITMLSEKQKKNVRKLVSPVPVREISMVFRQDYIREQVIKYIYEQIMKLIPEYMSDKKLKQYRLNF